MLEKKKKKNYLSSNVEVDSWNFDQSEWGRYYSIIWNTKPSKFALYLLSSFLNFVSFFRRVMLCNQIKFYTDIRDNFFYKRLNI